MPTSSQDYVDLEIRIQPLRGAGYQVKLVVNHGQEYSGVLDSSVLPWAPSGLPGQYLYDRLFDSDDLRSGWGEARGKYAQRCVRLSIDKDAPELHTIPWEVLREPVGSRSAVTLAAAADTPFSRYLYGGWEPGQPVQRRPVRMLVAIADAENLGKREWANLAPIDRDREWQAMREAVKGLPVDLVPLEGHCTLAALANKVAEGFHILHLVCHGAFLPEQKRAVLYLADQHNRVRRVGDADFAEALRDRLPDVPDEKRLRLVFLASCETAKRSPADAFRGVAPQLVAAGAPVVLAMQDLVQVDTARAFASMFYKKLLEHGRVDLACNQARAHVQADRLPGSSIPVLFMRLKDGRLLEVRSKEELAYLDELIERYHYRYRAEEYTAMPGIAEVARKGVSDRSPLVRVPPEFVMLKKRGGGMQAEVERVPVSDLRDAIEQHQRMVVLGEPGSGKTTTLWDLAYHHACEAQNDADAPLPVFVPLDGYTGAEPALQYIKDQVGDLAPQLTSLMKKGRVMLLLDALNEMPSVGYRERVRRIQALLSEFHQVSAVVTCRALDYVEELDLHKLEIQPLEPIRQREFLEKYLGHEGGKTLFWQMAGQDVADAWRSWQDCGGAWEAFWTAKTMPEDFQWRYFHRRTWEAIRDGKLPPLLALGRNPYMLFMTVQVYLEGDGVLARNRGELFARFARTLMLREERRADPDRWPGAEVLEHALVRLAYAMQSAGERGTAVDQEWAKTQLAVDGRDPAWLLHLARRASLMDVEGGKVRFVHQLIQEYFAALALEDRLAAGEDFRRYWPIGWVDPTGWEETCVLLAGIVPDMAPLVKQLLVANPPLAARCIAESGGTRPNDFVVQVVQQRLVDLLQDPRVDIPQRNAPGVAVNYVGDPRRGVGLRPDGLPDIEWVLVPERDPTTGQREFIYGDDSEGNRQVRTEPDFWMARYQITYAQFQTFLDFGDGFHSPRWWDGLSALQEHRSAPREQRFKHWNHPRENVSWYDAIAFCRWLTAKAKERPDLLLIELDLGREWKITLPTEWQWEKAARGHDGRKYPWGGEEYQSGYANIDETATQVGPHYLQKTTAVGMYPQGLSPYGIEDLSGNVWEWCLNEYDNPEHVQDEGSEWRVLRGGSWDYDSNGAAAPFRDQDYPDFRGSGYVGVRVVVVGWRLNA